MKTLTTIVLNYLMEHHNLEHAGSYGEPGYTTPEAGILLADWNDIDKSVANYLAEQEYAMEWSDEWVVVDDKAYRTLPDCYQWEPSVVLTNDCEWFTPEQPVSDWIEYAEMTGPTSPVRCLPSWVSADEIKAEGWVQQDETVYQSGFHAGMTDDPAALGARLFSEGAVGVLFQKVQNSQFYLEFIIYTKAAE